MIPCGGRRTISPLGVAAPRKSLRLRRFSVGRVEIMRGRGGGENGVHWTSRRFLGRDGVLMRQRVCHGSVLDYGFAAVSSRFERRARHAPDGGCRRNFDQPRRRLCAPPSVKDSGTISRTQRALGSNQAFSDETAKRWLFVGRAQVFVALDRSRPSSRSSRRKWRMARQRRSGAGAGFSLFPIRTIHDRE